MSVALELPTVSRKVPVVALAADPPEIDQLVVLLAAHRSILERFQLVAPDDIAHALVAELGIPVELLHQSRRWNGLTTRIEDRRVDAVIYLRDPNAPSDESISIARACDILSIPLATNCGAAEAVLHFLSDMLSDFSLYHSQ